MKVLKACALFCFCLVLCGPGCGSGSSSSSSSSSTQTAHLTEVLPLTFPAAQLPNAMFSTAYSATLAATGGVAPLTFSLNAGSVLPPGLTLSGTGTISGTPTATGTSNFTVQVADSSPSPQTATQSFAINVVPLSVTVKFSTSKLPSGVLNLAYSATVAATGGVPPLSFVVSSGSLPPGLTLNSSGTISGTPTQQGQFTFTLQVSDASLPIPQTATQAFTITITGPFRITSTTLPSATVAAPYSSGLSATGGTTPYSWSLTSGSLPTGLTLNSSTGVISGTPTQTGRVSFTITVADSSSPVASTAAASFAVNVFPELPRLTVDTTLPVQTGNSTHVAAGQDLQAAINAAQCGDTLMLQAGATFTGNYILPDKGCNGKWIIIRTDTPDGTFPVIGHRITPSNASLMPKIVTAVDNVPAVTATDVAGNFYRLIGLEITLASTLDDPNILFTDALVQLGQSEVSFAAQPHHIIIDRCYIHGTPTANLRRGVLLNGSNLAVINSNISDMHQIGFDTQAILGYNGPGPFRIENNRLEAAGENVLFGGASPTIPMVVPSDIQIIHNYFFKPLSWKVGDPTYAGLHWSVKNALEIKNGQRFLVDGNIFENVWADGQTGSAIVCTPRAINNGLVPPPIDTPNATCSELTFTRNVIEHVGTGFNLAGQDSNEPAPRPTRGSDIAIQNDIILDSNDLPLPGGEDGDGGLVKVFSSLPNLTLDHITGFGNRRVLSCDIADRNTGFVMTNNLAPHQTYGVLCSGGASGTPSLTTSFPGFTFADNVLVNPGLGGLAPSDYPASNLTCNASGLTCYPLSFTDVGLVDFNNCNSGAFDISTCALIPSSPYKSAGLDGADIGADVSAVLADTVNVKP